MSRRTEKRKYGKYNKFDVVYADLKSHVPEYPLTYCSKGLLTPAVHHHDYWHHMK